MAEMNANGPTPPPPHTPPIDWNTCREPQRMIRAVTVPLTARKLRLCACAAARRIWHLLSDPRTRAAVEVAERYADGPATLDDLHAACESAGAASWDAEQRIALRVEADPWWYGMMRGYYIGGPAVGIWASDVELGVWPENWRSHCEDFLEQLESGIGFAVGHAVSPLAPDTGREEGLSLIHLRQQPAADEIAHLAKVVRCLFPKPGVPVCFNPEWQTVTAVALAQRMYDSRDFSLMPILADALQDAGCDNAALLDHCRDAQAAHVRGCWVVDLVLGKV